MGPSITQLLIILAIVLVIFGAKRLRHLGSDLGGAIKGFREAMHEGEKGEKGEDTYTAGHLEEKEEGRVIDGEVTAKEKHKS
ncbi:MAG: Sec-independent protein translocase subunit TatA [Gammaproteobacteria bacterium]